MNIQQVVEELQSLPASGTRVPGFRHKVLVDIDRVRALGDELQSSVPAYVQEGQEIVKQKDSIINQAYLEAQRIKSAGEQEAAAIVAQAQSERELKIAESEIISVAEARGQEIKEEATVEAHEIIQDARQQAYQILNDAETAANDRRDGADHYAREVLFNLEERMSETLAQVRRGIDALRLEEKLIQSEEPVHA